MKKKNLIVSATAVLICFISFLVLSTHNVYAAESNEKYVAAKSGINLRSDAGKSSKVITLIPFGSKVTVEKSEGNEIFLDGRYGKWVNVKYGDKTGWVFSGFLCDFAPDTIIKPVADYYKNNQVHVRTIIANYIHLQILMGLDDIGWEIWCDVVWKYDVKQKKFFEVKQFEDYGGSSNFFHIDNDKYPDFVVFNTSGDIHIFLGTENGLKEIYDSNNDCNTYHDRYLTEGLCEKMKFVCSKTYDQREGGVNTMYFFRFNCDKGKVEKYAESKIALSDGIIKSIDFKNMTVVINQFQDSKDMSFGFSNKRFSTDEDIKYLKNFKKGDGVSIYYETVNGKKMILDIAAIGY